MVWVQLSRLECADKTLRRASQPTDDVIDFEAGPPIDDGRGLSCRCLRHTQCGFPASWTVDSRRVVRIHLILLLGASIFSIYH